MRKLTLENATSFLHFRAVCEKFRITFSYWVKKGGVYIVEAKEEDLASIGY